tara:strand:- start:5059 stop:5592 length:534 start_codon:yes stop_codon:yes gene_type:complete
MIKQIKTYKIKGNPNNPRIVKDSKFRKLVESLQNFPEMLKIRPIVVDENMTILGGNMRWKACKEAGLKDIWIYEAKDLTDEKKKEFVIKDNVNFGEWNWDMLGNEWSTADLESWGMDVWQNTDDIFAEEKLVDENETYDLSEVIVTMKIPKDEFSRIRPEIDKLTNLYDKIVCKIQN